MPLFEFALEIQHGDVCYEHKEFVVAASGELAMRFAREFALHWRPGAQHDQNNDVYASPEGYPRWTLARCMPVTHFSVPLVGPLALAGSAREKRRVQFALVPWEETFPQALHHAVELLGALSDSSLADCSLHWILTDHLAWSYRTLADVVHAVTALRESLPDDVPAEARQERKVST